MTVYALVLVESITDLEGVKRYGAAVGKVFTEHSVTALVREGKPNVRVIEGEDWPYGLTVLLSFADTQAFNAWYDSPEYKPLAQLRLNSTTGCMAMLNDLGFGDVEGSEKVYCLILIDSITDTEAFSRYGGGFMQVFSQSTGKLLVAENKPRVVEADWPYERVALIVFPNDEEFAAWYYSDGYQDLKQHRLQASTGRIALLRGVGHTES